ASEIRRWHVEEYEERSTISAIDPETLRSKKHRVVRLPTCRRCQPPGTANAHRRAETDGRLVLESRQRIRSTDGGWRAASPLKTFRKYEHHISPITGIVSYVRRQHGGSRVQHYMAEHVFASSPGEAWLNGKRISGGKGISRDQARTGALCEALERYSGIFRDGDAVIRASLEALGEAAIHPNACAHFSDAQFDNR